MALGLNLIDIIHHDSHDSGGILLCDDYAVLSIYKNSIQPRMNRLGIMLRITTITVTTLLTLGLSNAGFPFVSAIVFTRSVNLS